MGAKKRIADAVHGTISLNEVESEIIGTRAFQRLRGVKHLGMASLVFPGADYSRFSHGIGTMYVTSRILANLQSHAPGSLDEAEVRLYRAAALLHDIGHYPFSHTFERALKDFYAESIISPVGSGEAHQAAELGARPPDEVWMHERVGEHVIESDDELSSVLSRHGVDSGLLERTIRRVEPPRYANLISSDLDADRTDYLMRTAKHTGLPYGKVDLEYLLSQVCLDKEERICFGERGMRAAEHLLLSRYFDYQQVSYHKTVAGLEIVLNEAVASLMRSGGLLCSVADIKEMVADGRWHSFDDSFIVALLRKAYPASSQQDKALFDAVLHRNPPKMVGDWEVLGAPSIGETYRLLLRVVERSIEGWRDQFGLPFWVWKKSGTTLTKIGSKVPVSEVTGENERDFEDGFDQAVRILTPDGTSTTIQEHPRSLISVLSNYGLYSIRVYALLPPGSDPELRREIGAAVGEVFSMVD